MRSAGERMTKEEAIATNGIAEITQVGATLISTISAGSPRNSETPTVPYCPKNRNRGASGCRAWRFHEHVFSFRDGGHIKR
jgi:hypothetical protein